MSWAVVWPILYAVLSAVILTVAYLAIKSNWPDSYASVSDFGTNLKINRPISYIAFRLGPVFIIALFVSVNLERSGYSVGLFAVPLILIHGGLTVGKASFELMRSKRNSRRILQLLILHAMVFAALIFAVVLAVISRKSLEPFVPDVQTIIPEIWGALFVGILATMFYIVTSNRIVYSNNIVAKQRERIGQSLLDYARLEAKKAQCDPILLEAIMIAESIQRPKWFRRLERIMGLIYRRGTYGIMQVMSDQPIDDKESIDIAIYAHLHGSSDIVDSEGNYNFALLNQYIKKYNPSIAFVSQVFQIAEELYAEAYLKHR